MNRKLLLGNEAIALGAIRAGVRFASGYPRTPSSEILETIAREKPAGVYAEWSVNEKAALETANEAAIPANSSLVSGLLLNLRQNIQDDINSQFDRVLPPEMTRR
jgi:indolepyruvate ferredoxin oxidoreductase alpha subunit